MNVAQIWTDYIKEKKIDAQVEIFCCIHYNVWVKKIICMYTFLMIFRFCLEKVEIVDFHNLFKNFEFASFLRKKSEL